jgi:hypothetical protein
MKKIITITTGSLLLTALVYTVFELNKLKQQLKTVVVLKDNNFAVQQAMDNMIEAEIAQYMLSEKSLQGDSVLLCTLQEKCNTLPLFVFRFGDNSCDICVDNALLELTEIQRKKGINNILVIVNYQDLRRYRDIVNRYKGIFSFLNIEYGTYLYLENKNESLPPHFYILDDKNLIPKKLFFFVKECPELNQRYLDLISGLLKK